MKITLHRNLAFNTEDLPFFKRITCEFLVSILIAIVLVICLVVFIIVLPIFALKILYQDAVKFFKYILRNN